MTHPEHERLGFVSWNLHWLALLASIAFGIYILWMPLKIVFLILKFVLSGGLSQ